MLKTMITLSYDRMMVMILSYDLKMLIVQIEYKFTKFINSRAVLND